MSDAVPDQIYFEDIDVGDNIPELEKNPTSQQLVQWAAGSGDFYQIHYDTSYAQDTGLDDIIVHGALKHAFLGELLWRFAGPEGQVKRVQCSYRGMDPAAQGRESAQERKFTLRGTVTRKYTEGERNFVELNIEGVRADGSVSTPGTGTVVLPSRG